MLFNALVLLLIVWYMLFQLKRRRLYKLASQFEGPAPLPIIGNALQCMLPVTEISKAVLKNDKNYKSPIRFWIGPYFVLYVTDPEDIKIIMNNSHALEKLPLMYKLYEHALGHGLATLPVSEWKRHRRIMSPNFNLANLRNFLGIIEEHTNKLISQIGAEVGQKPFDVEPYFVGCTMHIVLDSLLEFKPSDINSERVRCLIDYLHTILVAAINRMSNVLYFSDFIFEKTAQGKHFLNAKHSLKSTIISIVEEWKRNIAEQPAEERNNIAPGKPVRFVEHLLAADDESGKLTTEEVLEEIQTFIVAGFETTSSMTGFFMLMLGMHPDIQEKIFQEVEKHFATNNRLDFDDLNKFDLLERAIKETLRIFPALAGGGRYNDSEIKLENHTIPSNTNIVIGILSLHRDPSIWPDPTKFDPDRFLPENEATRHPCSWIPFSAGPRNCIGFRFAWMEMKMISIYMIKHFKISTTYKSVEQIDLSTLVGVKPTHGYNISITTR